MQSSSVSPTQRFTRTHPCPICGGFDRLSRGQGVRCHGFASSDGRYAHCSRPEHAAGLTLENSRTYAHRLHGPCQCGRTHGEDMETMSTPKLSRKPKQEPIATYDYTDANGTLLGQVLRYEPKTFKQRRPKGSGWEWKEPETKVPYHLPALLATSLGNWVFIVEGEEDVHALESLGATATCNLGGANRDVAPLVPFFANRHVAIIPDNDEAGRAHAEKWERVLRGTAKEVLIVPLPGPEKSDPRDWVAAGGDPVDLLATLSRLQKLRQLQQRETREGAARVADDVEAFLTRFVVYPHAHARVAHTLWILHTWAMELWDSTPRIAFLSPEPQSGKTRALEVTEHLVPRPELTINSSTMALYRTVSDPEGLPTVLFDEIDTIFGPKAKGDEDIRAWLNAGHRKGAVAKRCVIVGNEVKLEKFPAYCAVAIAGLGFLPDTILSRSIVIRMHRRYTEEPIEQFRERLIRHEVTVIREKVQKTMTHLFTSMEGYYPQFPPEIENRDADVWEALFIIADTIGGSWPQRAREAAVFLVKQAKEVPPSLNLRLLKDIRLVFGDRDKMGTQHILDELGGLEDASWSTINKGKPMTTADLGARMRKYGLSPVSINPGVGQKSVRGFYRRDMQEVWLRYLGSVNPDPEELQFRDPAPALRSAVISVTPVTDTPNGVEREPPPF